MTKRTATERTAIVAFGNPLMGDDGVGPAVLDRLRTLLNGTSNRASPDQNPASEPEHSNSKQVMDWFGVAEQVEVFSGEISGLVLIPLLQDFDRIILIDAARLPAATPGEVRVLTEEDLDLALPAFSTAHDVGLKDLVSAVYLLSGKKPGVTLVAIQVKNVEMGIGLSTEASAAVPVAADVVLGQLG